MKKDARAKKIALVSHCVLNQNAVVGGLAGFPAAIHSVATELEKHDFGIVQMPCPEMYAAGLNRWGQVREQYRSAGFKRSFKTLASFTLDMVEDYVTQGYRIVLIGIKGSPSCGVFHTESNPRWGGAFVGRIAREYSLIEESGAFVEILSREADARGWEPFAAFELFDEEDDHDAAIRSLRDFLGRFD